MLAEQSQNTSQTQSAQILSNPIQALFSDAQSNGNGSVTKAQFEAALGAGGTNLQAADQVFSELDPNNTGSVSMDSIMSAMKGGHHGHHMHGSDSSSSSDADFLLGSSSSQSSGSSSSSTDPLMQLLQGASSSSATNSDGSTTTTITYADGSTVTMTLPASSSSSTSSSTSGTNSSTNPQALTFNMLEQMIQRQANALTASATQSLSLTA